jgi:hypothetical protein
MVGALSPVGFCPFQDSRIDNRSGEGWVLSIRKPERRTGIIRLAEVCDYPLPVVNARY